MSAETAPIAPMGPEVPGQAPPNMQKLELVPNPWETPQPSSDSEWLGGVAPEGLQPSNLDRVPLSEVLPPAEQQAKTGKIKKLGHFITGKFAKVTEVPTETFAAPATDRLLSKQETADWWAANTYDLPSNPQPAEMSASYVSKWQSLAAEAGLNENPPPTQEDEADDDWNPRQPVTPEDPGELAEPPAEMGTIERLEQFGYVRKAPRFESMLEDETRTNAFRYVKRGRALLNRDPSSDDEVIEMTEHEGLVALHDFLGEFVQSQVKVGEGDSNLSNTARGILENLTFIGEKEYAEAVKGLAGYWKDYLDADPNRQLCVTTKITENEAKRKSDVFLRENILASFSDEELAKYSGRIVSELDDITQAPENTKIIMLDDWTISGSQLRHAYYQITSNEKFAAYADSVEINLIAGSRNRIANGLQSNEYKPESPKIPVKAYFLAHHAPGTAHYEHMAHVTGTHSSVDYDFEVELYGMSTKLLQDTGGRPALPPLANIVRQYRYAQPRIIEKDGKIVRNEV